ncbi:clathrin assembly family protein [Babesia bovis T2Bo]|uniref:AP complex subunit sigma n=1 Tax=Babesia bovis TaxID=5865 RepID=A7ASD2_BABBO|nr:clathrin assembly family protein [Babesia bovis T2Bo]EDO07451.1 clathrin assembly family protein [Babesia bovis T2Bo]|eukprot:XP_001611019.1 clathrin assembly protein small subunit [Babesia bovis T2Bo]
MIKFILMINKQGQTRFSHYYTSLSVAEKCALEGEIFRKCLCRDENQSSFMHIRQHKIVYRRYASLYIIIGATESENELALIELIHNIVETLEGYFESVCEFDIMFNLEKVHYIINELICNGRIIDTNRSNVLHPLFLMDKAPKNA